MNQRYESRKEYSLMDVLQYNLRKWWLGCIERKHRTGWLCGKNSRSG